jgi:uncharacterized ion transporter superfamily protein YfcC
MLKKIPRTYVIVFSIVVLSAILTWIMPGGSYDRHTVSVNGTDRNVVIPGSFHYTGNNPRTWQIFSALFDGFVDKADNIVFILIIGGAFWIMNESKATDVAIQSFLRFSKRIEHNRIVSVIGADNQECIAFHKKSRDTRSCVPTYRHHGRDKNSTSMQMNRHPL